MRMEWDKTGAILVDRRPVASVDTSAWREKARVTIEGTPWEFTKASWKRLVGQAAGRPEMSAEQISFWRGTWRLHTSTGLTLDLTRAGMFSNAFRVTLPSGEAVVVDSVKWWSDRTAADVPDALPVADAVFLLWVCHILRRRANAAAAS